ncbi:uncharacterized protein LOC127712834 [Mytilus californianus]|uniref:uncharacterized protein LOC127712834 n=1 Tax=Mytilus californianus TaxID=6549 RepID=UPI0022462ACB|nr:uncharacterized protein LOC127712834 [Mytilus californianus]
MFIMAVDYCVTCNNNWYGDKCLRECNCFVGQRCDNVLGCINETTQTASNLSTTWNTEYVTQIGINSIETVDELEITNPTPTKDINNGPLDKEIVLYSVVIACFLVILGLSYLVVKYRQKTKIKKPKKLTKMTKTSVIR